MNQLASGDTLLTEMGRGGRVARSVEIASVLQKSLTTFQVRWVETEFANGLQRSREAYTGLFEIKLVSPTNEADAFNNPLGLFVTNFSWSREYANPPAAVPAADTATGATQSGGAAISVNGSRNQQ